MTTREDFEQLFGAIQGVTAALKDLHMPSIIPSPDDVMVKNQAMLRWLARAGLVVLAVGVLIGAGVASADGQAIGGATIAGLVVAAAVMVGAAVAMGKDKQQPRKVKDISDLKAKFGTVNII